MAFTPPQPLLDGPVDTGDVYRKTFSAVNFSKPPGKKDIVLQELPMNEAIRYVNAGFDFEAWRAKQYNLTRKEKARLAGFVPARLSEIAKELGGDPTPDAKWQKWSFRVLAGLGRIAANGKTTKEISHPVYSFSNSHSRADVISNLRRNYLPFCSMWRKPKTQGVRTCWMNELKNPPPISVLDKKDEVLALGIFDYITVFAGDESLNESCIDKYNRELSEARAENRRIRAAEREERRRLRAADPMLVGVIVDPDTKSNTYYPIIRWF